MVVEWFYYRYDEPADRADNGLSQASYLLHTPLLNAVKDFRRRIRENSEF